MIITCPSCSKRYLVEDSSIEPSGRQVQCVACQHNWFFKPAPGAKELEQVHLDLIGIESSKASPKSGLNLGWVLMIITFISITLGLVFARPYIMELWPSTRQGYQMVGLGPKPTLEGLTFENLRPLIEKTKSGQRLMLTGTVVNIGTEVRNMASLTIVVKGDCDKATWYEKLMTQTLKSKGAHQCKLAKWEYAPSESKIYPGERVAFETSYPRNIVGAKSIQVQF